MTMVGMNAAAVNLAVTKKYAADLAKQAIVVTYTVNASAAVMTAPWEITRFAQKGVTFYPTGSTPVAFRRIMPANLPRTLAEMPCPVARVEAPSRLASRRALAVACSP